MSSEAAASKRKASSKDARPAKKVKSTEMANGTNTNEKLKASADAKKARKRASDFIAEEDAKPVADSPKAKKVKISKKVEIVEPVPTSISKQNAKSKSGDKKKAKQADAKALVVAEQVEEIALPASDDEEDVAALLAGFSSDEDEVQDEKEEGVPLDLVPQAKLDKKAKKALDKAKQKAADEDTPGAIYVGRIPHGFYEPQMRAYFSQFGDILNLRLSRNKKTGASKHYAFVQFASSEVAAIVAKTMDNYLMFGHILKVRAIPPEQVHPELWKGANKRFKVVPRGMLERKEMARPKGREHWKGKVEKEREKREAKRKAMEELGYTYEEPALKEVDGVPMQEVEEESTEKVDEEAPKAIADAPADVDEVQVQVEEIVQKGKKERKEKVKVKASRKVKA